MFFFFQAEDGIRDYKVTGVQTCALPISRPARGRDPRPRRRPGLRRPALSRASRALRECRRAVPTAPPGGAARVPGRATARARERAAAWGSSRTRSSREEGGLTRTGFELGHEIRQRLGKKAVPGERSEERRVLDLGRLAFDP